MKFTNKLNLPVVAFEGMPMSGKSTILSKIIKESKLKALLLKELYFTKKQLALLKDKRGTIKESKWFIDQEVKRNKVTDRLKNNTEMILADRMYLSTLAYCYARSKITNNTDEFKGFAQYVSHNYGNFIQYDFVIIFENTIEASLSERRINKSSEDMEYWINRDFMEHYKQFYATEAEKYTKSKIIRINAEGRAPRDIYMDVINFLMNLNVKIIIK